MKEKKGKKLNVIGERYSINIHDLFFSIGNRNIIYLI
jgi:hypothetical protein